MVNDSSARIVADLRAVIARATPGTRLPPTRELVARHQASPLTVQRALRILAADGVIESRPGAGTFVRAQHPAKPSDYSWQTAAMRGNQPRVGPIAAAMRSAANDVIALHSGYPDSQLLPERLVRAALTRAARSDAALARPPIAGLPGLQAWFASELGGATRAGVTAPNPTDVIVVPGSQNGLRSLFRALVTRGQPVLMESPTYWGAILAAAHVGVDVVPVPSGPAGPDPDELDRAFRESGARVFYAQPNYANPTGAQWPAGVADQVMDVVRRHRAFLIEDDWACDFGITTQPTPVAARDDAGHVIYLRSLTKSVSPAVRIAAVIARGPARERILADHAADSMYVSGLLQTAALDVVTQPAWSSHLRAVRQQLKARRDLLMASLTEHVHVARVDHVPAGGLNLWVQLPDEIDVVRLTRECEQDGLLIAPGPEWFPAEPTGSFVRLNFAGPNPDAFGRGAQILASAIASQSGR